MPSFCVDGPSLYDAVHVHAFNLGGPDADQSAWTAFVERKTDQGRVLPKDFLNMTCGGLIAGTYGNAASKDPTCMYKSVKPSSAIYGAVQDSAAQSAFRKAGLHSTQMETPLQITIHASYSQARAASRVDTQGYSCFIGSAADTADSRRHFGVKPDGTGLEVGTLMPGVDGTVCGKKDASDVKTEKEEDMTVA